MFHLLIVVSNSSFLLFLVFFNVNLTITLGLTSCNAIMPKLSTVINRICMISNIMDYNAINICISPCVWHYHTSLFSLVLLIYV